jgi:hypothetical protein
LHWELRKTGWSAELFVNNVFDSRGQSIAVHELRAFNLQAGERDSHAATIGLA